MLLLLFAFVLILFMWLLLLVVGVFGVVGGGVVGGGVVDVVGTGKIRNRIRQSFPFSIFVVRFA